MADLPRWEFTVRLPFGFSVSVRAAKKRLRDGIRRMVVRWLMPEIQRQIDLQTQRNAERLVERGLLRDRSGDV